MAVATLKKQLSSFEIPHIEGLNDPNRKSGGEGSYGTVYEVVVEGVPRIAKQLHKALVAPDVRPGEKRGIYARFCEECLLLSGLDHPNIVKFIGIHSGSEKGLNIALVMEKLNTDLEKYLMQTPKIPTSQKLSILLDVSSGLVYLHSRQPPIIHRDLTCGNILLTETLAAKIADFGVSRVLNIHPNSLAKQTKCPGTLAYMPPEAQCENPIYDKALDIFSFGEVCLCTIHQQFAEFFDASRVPEFPAAHQRGEIEILKRKKWFDRMPANHCLRDVATSCLQDRPERRPTTERLKEVITELCIKELKTELTVLKNKPEFANRMEELHQEVIRLYEELSNLQKEKNAVEDELNIFRIEAEADHTRHEATKRDLARSQSLLATATRGKGASVGEDKHEMELLKADASLTKTELTVLKNKSEFATRMEELHQETIRLHEELSNLRKEKNAVEDELEIFRNGVKADHTTHEATKRDLARSQSLLAAAMKEKGVPEGEEKHELQILNTEASLTKIENKELKHEMQLLQAEASLTKIENKELGLKVQQLAKNLTELGKAKLSLERTVTKLKEEQEQLVQENIVLKHSKHQEKVELKELDKLRYEAGITQEHLMQLADTIVSKTDENESLRMKLNELEGELQASKFQAWQYEQDFREERAAREKAIGTKDDQFGEYRISIQKLSDRLQESVEELAKTIEERDNLGKQLQQANNDFERTFVSKSDEIKNLREQKAQVSAELDQYKEDFLRCQQQFETDKAAHEHTRTELQHQIKTLKEKAAQTEDDKNRLVGEKLATELQEARERLETSLADSERLHDEVMAKTAQVKQYKKQTDSYKAKLDEATAKLQRTQLELQQSKDLVKTMEEENQYQIEEVRARAESDKLAAETDMIKFQRKIEYLERELQAITNEGNIPEAVKVEIRRRLEVEQKLRVAEEKINQLFDSKNRMDMGPPVRASDPSVHEYVNLPNNVFDEQVPQNPQHQGGQHQQGQQNQQCPQQQHSVYYSPNQQRGNNQGSWQQGQQAAYHQTPPQRVIPAQNQGYAHSGPDYNQVQSNPSNSPGYQHNYPPVSHAQGQFGVDQSPTPGVQYQAMLSQQALVRQQPPQHGYVRPQHVVPQQNLVPHQQALVPAAQLVHADNDTDTDEDSDSKGLDTEIHEMVAEVVHKEYESDKQQTIEQIPFDPNLVCPVCRKQFRKGEIQKFRKHANKCAGEREQRAKEMAEKLASDTKPFSLKHT